MRQRVTHLLDRVRAGISAARANPRLAGLGPALRVLCAVALISYLAYTLLPLGWSQIWASRPESWLFYVLLPVSFVTLPFADLLIYRYLWRTGSRLKLQVLLRKQLMNSNFFDFSGETYLFMWGKRSLPLSPSYLLHSIKDSSILSGIAGWAFILTLLTYLATTGRWLLPMKPDGRLWLALIGGAILIAALLAVGMYSRRVTTLSRRQIGLTFAIHLARVAGGQFLHIAFWALALPFVSLTVWLNLLALRLLISRLGFIPNRDLLFVGAGVGFAGTLDVPQAGVAAVLLIVTASEHVLNLLLVGLPTLAGSARVLAEPKAAAR